MGNPDMGVAAERLKGRNIGQDFTLKDGWRMYHGREVPGFPYHPHRGFETITINKEGVVDHSDSLGAAGRFMGGDVQWMTAGKGVQHSEMFPLVNEDKGNTLEIFQIWLNLPKAAKMTDPHFKMLWKEDIPVIEHVDAAHGRTTITLVAGRLGGTNALDPTPGSWAADPDNAVGVYTVHMAPKAQWTLPRTDARATRSIFYYRGNQIEIDGRPILSDHLIEARPDEDITITNGDAPSFMLVLEGRPIGEPVVQHGPFVMNTAEEIREAMRDYGRTQFGGWPWQKAEMVHPREKGRFALHANGREEVR